jgi:predicted ATPase/DNA-binding SARP family transcriptional activator
VRLLGPAQVEREGQPAGSPASGKALALLGYLAVRDQPVAREHLAELFWPDKPANRGRANLSWLLHQLAGRLPGFLVADRHSLRFERGPPYWLDLHAFADLLARGDVPSLAEAVDLYRGELLDGLHLDGCADFELWLVGERERWRRRVARTLRELLAHHDRSGERRQGLHYARRLLSLEPWLEETHRQVMRLLALGGRRAAALAQYETCCRILAEELGVEPGPETTQLYERIRDGTLAVPGVKHRSLQGLDLLAQSPSFLDGARVGADEASVFVARQRELAQLDRALDKALAGQGRVLFVTGDAGQGKTALIHEFARRAQELYTGLVVAGGRGNAHTGSGDPYLPFREVLDLLTGDVQAPWEAGAMTREQAHRLWQTLPLTAQALVEAGPDLIDTFVPGGPLLQRAVAFTRGLGDVDWLSGLERLVERKAALPADPTLQQSALFRQYTRVLQALASRRGLVLLLDDLQWADAGSVGLLFHLGREVSGQRILIVGAYRPAEVALDRGKERHPLAPVVNELRLAFGEVEVALTEDDLAFVGALLDTEPNRLGADFRDTLRWQTGGHPLFTVELLRGMQERGELVQDKAGCWVEGPDLDWQVLPARVGAVIAERIGRLPGALQEALSVASVEGETFTAEVVARVTQVGEAELLRCLSGQLDRGHRLVRAQGVRQAASQRLSRYRFRHILFQKYLYGQLDAVERAHLHRAVGTELETLWGAEGEEAADVAGQLARHLEAGGVPQKAVVYRLQAGQRATRLSAHEEAITHFSRGLALLETLPDTAERDRQELALQVGLAVSLLPTQGYSAAEVGRTYARARELSEQMGETPQRFQVLWLTYTFHAGRGEHRTAHELGQQLLRLAQRADDLMLEMMARWVLGWNRFFVGEFAEARLHLEQAIAAYDPEQHHYLAFLYGQDPGVLCRSKLACVLWSLGYPEQGLARCQEAVALGEELSHPLSLAFCYGLAALLHLFSRDAEATRASAKVCIRLSTEYGFSYWLASSMYGHGWSLVEQERIEEGLTQMFEAMAGFQATGMVIGCAQLYANLAEACGKAGQVDEGLALLDKALAFAQRTGERFYDAEIHRLRGELLLAQGGDVAEVERHYRQAIEVAHQQAARSWELRATMSLAHLLVQQGRKEEARRNLAEIYGWFSEGFNMPDLQEAQELLRDLEQTTPLYQSNP